MAEKMLFSFRTRGTSRESPGTASGSLSEREAEVLELIASGSRDKEIAERLVITEGTVKKHVQNILRKLHARNRAEAVARVRR